MDGRENRLASATSPYLRQHRYDPVDWYPYGEEAIERARQLDRPLLLSIGYSACHWCHVMAHESFADPATAELMNDLVVAVKIDREERPDLDAVYMEAVVAANGHGGWPMTVFALPDGRPFFTGTYFPNVSRHSMPSFTQVLKAVGDVWSNRRADVESQAEALALAVTGRLEPPREVLSVKASPDVLGRVARNGLRAAVARLSEIDDPEEGGFGRAPKFPQALLIDLLLRAHAYGATSEGSSGSAPLGIALRALEAMASGGIYDQVGGGFSRYSVDRKWVVPHFEKMLYDQALIARALLHAWQATGDVRWRQVMDETLSYVLTDLLLPSGAIASAEDADSEGEEGKFYVWSLADLRDVAGADADAAVEWYGATAEGNFEGRNILVRAERGSLARPPEVERARAALARARAQRVRPSLDDKVVTEWNAMACAVLAEAAGVTGDQAYRSAAETVAQVILDAIGRNGGRTPRLVRRADEAASGGLPGGGGGAEGVELGFSVDVAWTASAFVALYEATGEVAWLTRARERIAELLEWFIEGESTVHTTPHDAPTVVVRPVELLDNGLPSAVSVAALACARLAALTGEGDLSRLAERLVARAGTVLERSPAAAPELLHAAELLGLGTIEVVGTGGGIDEVAELRRRRHLPNAVFALAPRAGGPAALALLEGREGDAVFVCAGGTCRLPVTTAEAAIAEVEMAMARIGLARP